MQIFAAPKNLHLLGVAFQDAFHSLGEVREVWGYSAFNISLVLS
jgi:hypothetical protein